MNSLSSKSTIDAKIFLNAFAVAQEGAGKKIRQGRFRILFRDAAFNEATKTIRAFTERYVDKALAMHQKKECKESALYQMQEGPQKVIFLHELAKQLDNKVELRDQLLSVFTAGHESTAIITSHVFFLLSRHPATWQRLHAEVLSLNDMRPNFEQLKSMTYLRWVINESKTPLLSLSSPSSSRNQQPRNRLTAFQPFASFPWSLPIPGKHLMTPYSPPAAASQAVPLYSFPKAPSSPQTAMSCTAASTSLATTPKNLDPSDGRRGGRAGTTCRLAAAQGYVPGSSWR